MSAYQEASQLKAMLMKIANEAVENNPSVKNAIKAQKAVVWEAANTTAKTVKIKFLADIFNNEIEPLVFPYNSKMETFLASATPKQTIVSVWYNQSINNGIVMQNGDWSI